jgi:hypothetical protein
VRRAGDAAAISVSSVPSTLEAGSELNVSVNLRNVGTRGWSSDDAQPVRLLVRWYDVTAGRRSRWEIKWLRADVAPGGSTQLSADITVPPRADALSFIFLWCASTARATKLPAPIRVATRTSSAPYPTASRCSNRFNTIWTQVAAVRVLDIASSLPHSAALRGCVNCVL